ncbi:hypothetical protein INT47_009708 [Mucor saturninus]|uniref:PAP-associated domain-containing protein n=1 Tax=Mucor saturninus TaxID=64648 RepID=A0A8H7UXL7_9FUNG|nr:hypothetical protein INT47_009708 [Mucor saturninus]
MDLKHPRSKDEKMFRRTLLDDYGNFRRLLHDKNLTVQRLPWQPYVIHQHHWNQHDLFDLVKQLKAFPELGANLAIEKFDYKKYIADSRYTKKLFADLVQLDGNPLLYVFFPRSYNKCSLTAELSLLEKPSPLAEAARDRIVDYVRSIFRKHWPCHYMKFIPFGSHMYGVSFFNSPLNICIELDEPDLSRLLTSKDPYREHIDEPYCTDVAIDIFYRHGGDKFHFSEDIGSVRTKLENTNIEYNFNNGIFTESTNLIGHYLTLDPRVQPFLYAIKVFGRGRNIFASQISNGVRYYGYVIMALAYLSQLDTPVVPNLQHINHNRNDDECYIPDCSSNRPFWDTVIYGSERVGIAARYHNCVSYDNTQPHTPYFVQQNPDTGKLYWHSKNESSVGELLIDFFYYYGYEFDYDKYAVSLKFGGKTAIKSVWKQNDIAIEDPFMVKSNIAAGAVGERFRDVLRGAFTVLHSGICFEILYKKIAEIVKYDSLCGIDGNRPLYKPMKRWKPHGTSKACVLIGLPKTDVLHCYCDRIMNLFSTHGKISSMVDLDGSTKQIIFTSDTGDAMDIVLPSTFVLDNGLVHLVELYECVFIDPV